jgi:hypothetical protein
MKEECYKCGKKGHFINDCPIKGPQKNIIIQHIRSDIIIGEKENGGNLSHIKYNKFSMKCKDNCQVCDNTRISYKYRDEDNDNEYVYMSCDSCYKGDDWENDMFVVRIKQLPILK